MIKVLSLFDGISGARQALKELNIDCAYYASEIDKFAIQVSKNNYLNIVQIGNVKGIIIEDDYIFYNQDNDPMQNGGSFKSDVDLLIGGSPCQDLSVAKRNGKGLEGERSGLFYEYLRILHKVKPRYFVLENVASMKKTEKDKISLSLGLEPIMINSALLTAQQRKRLYWVGKLQEDGSYKKIEISQPEDKGILLKDILEEEVDQKYFLTETGMKYLEKIKYKGVRLIDDKAITLTASSHKGIGNDGCTLVKVPIQVGRNKLDLPNGDYFEHGQRQLVFKKPVKVGHFNKGGQGDRVYNSDGKSVCLSANGGGRGAKTGLYEIKDMVRKLTPNECARLQGYPDFYHNGISNSQAYKCYGNSFTVPVIKHILQHLFFEV